MLAFWIFFRQLRQNACSQVLQSECCILHSCKRHCATCRMFQLRDTLIFIGFHLNSVCAHHFKMLPKKNCQLESLCNFKSALFFLTSGLFCFLRECWCNLISHHKMAQTLADKSVGGSLKTASYTDVCDHLSNTGNKTEEGSEFMTQTMLTATVAWDALYRGVWDHGQLTG